MKSTVWANVARIGDGLAVSRSPAQRLLGAHATDAIDPQLAADVAINIDHDPRDRVGQVTYAEVGVDGVLRIVGVLDDDAGEALARVHKPVYASAEFMHRGDVSRAFFISREAQLLSVALTFSPATIGLMPVQTRAGDYTRAFDRSSWPIGWPGEMPLVKRALNSRRGLNERSAATRVVDARKGEIVPMGSGAYLVEGELVAPLGERHTGDEDGRSAGAWRHHPCGPILSVR